MSESLSREQLLDYIKKQKLKIKKLEAKSTELTSQLECAKETKQTEESSSQYSKHSDELEECYDKICGLEEELEAKNREHKDLQNCTKNRIKLLENEVNSKSEEVVNLQGKVAEDGEALVEYLRTIQTLKEAFNEKDCALEEQLKLNADLQSQLIKLQEETTEAEAKAKVAASVTPCNQCVSHEATIQELEQTVNECQVEVSTKSADIDSQQQHLAASDARVGALMTEISDLKKKAEVTHQTASQDLATVTADLESQLAGQKQSTAREVQLKEEKYAYDQQILRDEIEQLKRELLDSAAKKTFNDMKILELEDSLANLKAETDTRIEEQLTAAHAQGSDAKYHTDLLKTQLSDLVSQKEEWLADKTVMLAKQNTDGVMIMELQDKVSTLHAELEATESRCDLATQELLAVQQDRDSLTLALSSREETTTQEALMSIQSLQAELDTAQAELTRLQPLNGQVTALTAEITDLKAQLDCTSVLSAAPDGDSSKPRTSSTALLANTNNDAKSSSPSATATAGGAGAGSGAGAGGSKKSRKRNKNKAITSVNSAEDITPTPAASNNSNNNDTIPNESKDISSNANDSTALLEKVTQLEVTVALLHRERDSLNNASEENVVLQSKVQELQIEINNLTEQLSTMETELQGQKEEYSDNLIREATSLDNVISEKEELILDLEKKVDELTHTLEQVQRENAVDSGAQEQTLQKEIEELGIQLAEKDKQCIEATTDAEAGARRQVDLEAEVEKNTQLRAECVRLQQQLQLEQSEHQSHLSALDTARVLAADLETNCQDKSSQLEDAQTQLVELEIKIKESATTLSTLKVNLEAKEEEVCSYVTQLTEANAALKILTQDHEQKQKQEANVLKNSVDLEEQLSAASAQAAVLTADNSCLQATLDTLQAAAQASEKASAATHAAQDQQIQDLTAQLNLLTVSSASASSADQDLHTTLEVTKQALLKAETTVSKYKQMVKSKMKEINDLTESLKQAKCQVQALDEGKSGLEQQISAMQGLEASAKDVSTENAQQMGHLQTQVSQYENELAVSADTILKTKEKLTECEKQCHSQKVANEKLTIMIEKQGQELTLIQEKTQTVAQQDSSEHEQHIQSLLRSHIETTAHLEVTISELKEELEGEKKEVFNLKEAVKVVNANFTAKFEKERSDTLAEQQV